MGHLVTNLHPPQLQIILLKMINATNSKYSTVRTVIKHATNRTSNNQLFCYLDDGGFLLYHLHLHVVVPYVSHIFH